MRSSRFSNPLLLMIHLLLFGLLLHGAWQWGAEQATVPHIQREQTLAKELSCRNEELAGLQRQLNAANARASKAEEEAQIAQFQLQYADGTLSSLLFLAIVRNDARAVNALLEQGVNPNARDKTAPEQQTALLAAITMGYVESPIYPGASPRNNLAVVRALLRHGANVNLTCRDGITSPLSVTRRHGSEELLALLIKAGAKEREE